MYSPFESSRVTVLFNVTLLSPPVSTHYRDGVLLYTLQGLVNRDAPRLFFDTGADDMDFPQSDRLWAAYLAEHRGVAFDRSVPASVCDLVSYFNASFDFGTVLYRADNYSEHIAATVSAIHGNLLPVSDDVIDRYPCLNNLPVRYDLVERAFTGKLAAYRWAIDALLPQCDHAVVHAADNYNNAVPGIGQATLMSLDYPIAKKAFIMNLSPLWVCDPLDCGKGGHRRPEPEETRYFVEVLSKSDPLVSVWGWGDPEHAYTNITTQSGGVVFCTFSSPNLAFWAALGEQRRSTPLPLPHPAAGHSLDRDAVYLLFETNEGDTPRILTSQFASAWLSPHRGRVPVSWAVDPLLGRMFPELWNFFMSNTTQNDSFVAGVDGGGYVYLASFADAAHAAAYEERVGGVLAQLGPPGAAVVDVGVAQA